MERWFFPIRRVAQVDINGCAIACLAMVAGLSYGRARSEVFPRRRVFRDDATLMVDGRLMCNTFDRLGFTSRFVDTYVEHKAPAILTFQWYPGAQSSDAHCIVWDPFRKRMLDPAAQHLDQHTVDQYLGLWRQSNMCAVIVTGKR